MDVLTRMSTLECQNVYCSRRQCSVGNIPHNSPEIYENNS